MTEFNLSERIVQRHIKAGCESYYCHVNDVKEFIRLLKEKTKAEEIEEYKKYINGNYNPYMDFYKWKINQLAGNKLI
jgi:hypothetical protein